MLRPGLRRPPGPCLRAALVRRRTYIRRHKQYGHARLPARGTYRPASPGRPWSARTCRHNGNVASCRPSSIFLVREPGDFGPRQRSTLILRWVVPIREVVAAANDTLPGNIDQTHRLCFAGFEAHRRAGGNIEAFAVRLCAVEAQFGIGFNEMIMAADLHRTVAQVGYRQTDALTPRIEFDLARLNLIRAGFDRLRFREKKRQGRHRKKTAL